MKKHFKKVSRIPGTVVKFDHEKAKTEPGVTYVVSSANDQFHTPDFGARLTLEDARATWLLGDWERLARPQQAQLENLANRELLALLVGSACLQLGKQDKGGLLIEQSRKWGCPSNLIAKILVAGVHLSLSRAELLRNDGQKSYQHVLAAIKSISPPKPVQPESLAPTAKSGPAVFGEIPITDLKRLGIKLGTDIPPPASSVNPLNKWEMIRDDGPILRYLFEVHQPKRHLEFGTWRGWGTCLCLETTAATVWTINLPDGEAKADGSWAYGERVYDTASPAGAVELRFGQDEAGPIVYHRTDAGGHIGWLYRKKELGHRVCQIFCDSRKWDNSAFPANFFDSAFIDGGHQTDVVISDTRKALSVLRPGGMIIWHDFCPVVDVCEQSTVVREVTGILEALLPEISSLFTYLSWINPSMILVGIKK